MNPSPYNTPTSPASYVLPCPLKNVHSRWDSHSSRCHRNVLLVWHTRSCWLARRLIDWHSNLGSWWIYDPSLGVVGPCVRLYFTHTNVVAGGNPSRVSQMSRATDLADELAFTKDCIWAFSQVIRWFTWPWNELGRFKIRSLIDDVPSIQRMTDRTLGKITFHWLTIHLATTFPFSELEYKWVLDEKDMQDES